MPSLQFTTLAEAQDVAAMLNAAQIGGGVMPYNRTTELETNPPYQDADPKRSGIYIPVYAVGPFPTPSQGEKSFYHLRFQNGAEGFNAGLVKATMKQFPTSWPLMVALEVAASAANARAAND